MKHRKSYITTRKVAGKRRRVKVEVFRVKGKRKYAVRRLTHKGRSTDKRRHSKRQPWERLTNL